MVVTTTNMAQRAQSLWHSTVWLFGKGKVAIKYEIHECTSCSDSKPSMSRFKAFEISAASMSLSVCISNWPKGMSNLS